MAIIPPKIKGIKRILRAFEFSWDGLTAAYKSEEAFRHDVWLACVLLPLSFFIDATRAEHILLVGTIVLVLICELVNTAIEVVIERISPDWHYLSKKAKDIGSALVFLALVLLAYAWGTVLFF